MACPFFLPIERVEAELWPQRRRLPLGDGWRGCCMANGEPYNPSEDELKEFCNLGYARGCGRLPQERAADAVRFAMSPNGNGRAVVHYALEREHRPAGHGALEYDPARKLWNPGPADARIRRMAECFLAAYLERHPRNQS